MKNNSRQRTDAYDVSMVQKYLEQFPQPSVGTMKAFNAPEEWTEDWNNFINESWEHKMKIFKQAFDGKDVLMDGLPVVAIRNLFVKYDKQAVELEPCESTSMSAVQPYAEYVRYKCISCDEEWVFSRELAVARPKKKCCTEQNIIQINTLGEDSVDSQIVRLQEIQYDGTTLPVSINGILKGDMVWSIKFNERVKPIGVLRHKRMTNPRTQEPEYQAYFDIYGVKRVDPDSTISLTDKDIEYIRKEMAQPGFYDKLIRSFAPHIWGMHSFKEAIILALASIKLPKPARILMVTDPGMAKSKLIQYTCSLMSNAYSVQMGRATKTGLTISSERDEETGRRHVGRGAFAQAHNGLLCIDEMQMGEARDFANLNDVMESMQLKYAFPGGNVGHIDASCALIMACNPHEGSFAGEQSMREILKFMGNDTPQFTSRTQLILMRPDKFTVEEQRKIAEHMVMHNENNPRHMEQYYNNWYDDTDMQEEAIQILPGLTAICNTPAERFGTKWIKKIFKYVINHVEVSEMPQEQARKLVDYYMKNRGDVASRVNKLITNRFMAHGQNLAMYMARVKGKSSPGEEEIVHTMEVLERSMSIAAFDPKTNEIDTNMFNNSRPKSELEKMNEKEQWVEACHQAMKNSEDGKYFSEQELTEILTSYPKSKWTDIKVQVKLQDAMRYGKILQKGNKYTWFD